MEIMIPMIVLGLLGLGLGGFLAYSSKKFEVEIDPNVENVLKALPGANCGACGYPGCSGYAEAIVNQGEEITLCAPGGDSVREKIGDILGKNAGSGGVKKVARVMCHGGNDKTKQKYDYDTEIKTCASANLYFSGDKSCSYGCLGYGDCVRVCPFDAIHINEKGIAEVDEEKCTACNKCVVECPKNIIELVPETSKVTVFCKSKEKALDAKKACEVACIGCGICVRSCPYDAITLVDNLAKIDPEKCKNCGICAIKCPTNAIISELKERKVAKIDEEKCVGCTICKTACPFGAIEGELKQKHKIDPTKCVGCEVCVSKCPTKAITMETKVELN